METTVRYRQWMVIAGSAGDRGRSDRGELVSVHDTVEEAARAARICGLHPRTLDIGMAGDHRTPRGATLVDSRAAVRG